ncbi:MAG: hypothetical protein AAFR59_07810, partial [Bacteroidota bacterium]
MNETYPISYDWIARGYDQLAKWVYGDLLLAAQREAIAQLGEGAHVLWIGGGTGRVIPALLEQKIASLTFVDASQKMLDRAQHMYHAHLTTR